jgi:hypothetical protein
VTAPRAWRGLNADRVDGDHYQKGLLPQDLTKREAKHSKRADHRDLD